MSAEAPNDYHAAEIAAKVEQEIVRLGFGSWVQYVDGIPFGVVVAAMMSGLWPALGNTDPFNATVWLVALTCWSLGALGLYMYYAANPARHTPAVWRRMQYANNLLHGLTWGSMAWVFWEHGNTVNQAVLCIITLGVIVGMFFLTTANIYLLCISLGTLTLMIWSAFVYDGGALASVFMFMFPAFSGLLLRYGHAASNQMHGSLFLRFENQVLAEAVTRANRAKSDFLASMSHELRTPLNSIIGYSDLMRHETFGPIGNEKYAGYIEDIASSGGHLLRMINDLLDLAKIESGKREFDMTMVNLTDVAKDVIRIVEPMAGRAFVNIMFDPKQDIFVNADERAVKQMLLNLLSNAVKYSRAGGIAIILMEVTQNDRVIYGVKDTGLGMTAEEQQQALEPFVQAGHHLETVEGNGTGLGLPIVKGLIDAHNGMLRIESTKGVGSRIWVEFPPERLMRVTPAKRAATSAVA